jgi:hypothetical protein
MVKKLSQANALNEDCLKYCKNVLVEYEGIYTFNYASKLS